MIKMTSTREALLRPLKTTAPLTSGKQILPILSHVMISAAADGVTMTATDTEAQITSVPDPNGYTVETPGVVCAPARKLFDIIRLMPDAAEVSIEVIDARLNVTAGRSKFRLLTLPADSFPAFDPGDVTTTITLPRARLQRALDATAHAMGVDDVRNYLNGTLLRIENGTLTAVGSDGHRLSTYAIDLGDLTGSAAASAIIPRRSALEIAKMLRDGAGPNVTLRIGARSVSVDTGSDAFATRTIEASYPRFERLIPESFIAECNVGTSSLASGLQRVGAVASGNRGARVEAGESLIRLSCASAEDEQGSDEIEARIDGEAVTQGYNIEYLLAALGQVTSQHDVRLQFADTGGCMITDPSDDALMGLIMPMRL